MTRGRESGEPVTVLETGDPGLLAVAKSLLEDAGIPYFAKGEAIQNLFGAGTFGTGFNVVTGPVELQVAECDAAQAHALLIDLASSAGGLEEV